MLRSVQDLQGATLRAIDGEIGSVDQFLFDDESWTIRYLVVNTGSWLDGRIVLLSPRAVMAVDWEAQAIAVNLTQQKIKEAPDIATDQPVSRQMEATYSSYYGYPPYWGGVGLWGAGLSPYAYPTTARGQAAQENELDTLETEGQGGDRQVQSDDTNLRSAREVSGYHIRARDGEIGHVEDFLLDDETWAIRYLVVDTGNRWFGNHVLVSPAWVTDVSWSERLVDIDLTRGKVETGPQFDRRQLNRLYEQRLHRFYGRSGYWERAS
jgi:hypothetical protein